METSILVDELFENIDIIQNAFLGRYNFKIFKDFDLRNIGNLKKEVKDLDGLKLRVNDATTQIIENFNKKELDLNSGTENTGSINSFRNFLLHNYAEETELIEQDIHNKFWAVYNVRTQFSHKKNRNYKKALKILNLSETEVDATLIWEACIEALNTAIKKTVRLILQTPEKEDYIYFQDLAIEKLRSKHRVKISHLISNYPDAEPYVLYLVHKNWITDVELANIFNHQLIDVRNRLFPLVGEIITYQHIDNGSTKVIIHDEVKSILKELFNNNEN